MGGRGGGGWVGVGGDVFFGGGLGGGGGGGGGGCVRKVKSVCLAGMATRSRSERLEGSSCFFWASLDGMGDGVWVTYLEGVGGFGVLAPVAVHVEAYDAKDGEVEEDFPAGDEASEAIERVSKVCGKRIFLRHWRCWEKNAQYGCVRIAFAELVGEQDAYAKDPGRRGHVGSG